MVLVIALALLFGHSFGIKGLVVDNISLVLLAIVLVSPFIAAIKKVNTVNSRQKSSRRK
jgi:hypothetical protein